MPKVIAEISARHIHLSEKDLFFLFGKAYLLKKQNSLSQPGEFAAKETLTVKAKKNSFPKVRIIGPIRKETQVELSVSDCIFLGVKPVLNLSGDLKNSSAITLIGPKGILKLKKGTIVAKRHLHLSKKDAQKWALKNKQKVKVKISGSRAMLLEEVIVRVGDFQTRLHLDTDEANAAGIKNKQKVLLEI
ncbi:phosphate propanoyltransferase [Candidatus Nomurabacteria bacterium]|nr:phosphate propanoyltransferase [Candidatus Nomurabacteria bacterium]